MPNAKVLSEKQAIVAALTDKLQNAAAGIIVDYKGITVAEDPVYGPHNCITSLHGQCLHAKTLGFVHPITGEQLRFDSELPDYFTHFLATLRRKNT